MVRAATRGALRKWSSPQWSWARGKRALRPRLGDTGRLGHAELRGRRKIPVKLIQC